MNIRSATRVNAGDWRVIFRVGTRCGRDQVLVSKIYSRLIATHPFNIPLVVDRRWKAGERGVLATCKSGVEWSWIPYLFLISLAWMPKIKSAVILLRAGQEISKRSSCRVPPAQPTETAQLNTVRLRVDETPQAPGLSTYYYCLGKYTHWAAVPAFSGSFFQLPVRLFNTQSWGRTSIKGWTRHVTCKDTPISSFMTVDWGSASIQKQTVA